jgi:shikimate dehydrogenase
VFDALKWPAVYALFDLPPRRLKQFVTAAADAGIVGFNVTQPYKVRILDHLDSCDSTANAIGAVNTVICRGRRLIGSNSDVDGIETVLAPHRRELQHASVVVLGAGGAARAVAYTLDRSFNVRDIAFAVRSLPRGRRLVRELKQQSQLGCTLTVCPLGDTSLPALLADATMLVNATPVGSGAYSRQSPLPRNLSLPASLIVFDLIYRPRPTPLLRRAQGLGCRTVDGWGMLVGQAEAAFRLWTGRRFPSGVRRELVSTEIENIG